MNPPKCTDLDYIQFLIAAQRVFTCTEAARCHPEDNKPPAHDALTRLLCCRESLQTLRLCGRKQRILILDDTTLDKPYARKIDLVTRHWSGKHKRVVQGINLITLVWTDGVRIIPCDYRVYDAPNDGLTKNDHFRAMLKKAYYRGFKPKYVVFDSWYASLKNLKEIRRHSWYWLTRLKSNHLVNPDKKGNVQIKQVEIQPEGQVVHLKGYGFTRVFQTVTPNGDVEYWATNELSMDHIICKKIARQGWVIEEYHRGLKQCCGVERAQARVARAQRNHILYAIRAFLRLEINRLRTGISWYEAKIAIIRDAIRNYLSNLLYSISSTA